MDFTGKSAKVLVDGGLIGDGPRSAGWRYPGSGWDFSGWSEDGVLFEDGSGDHPRRLCQGSRPSSLLGSGFGEPEWSDCENGNDNDDDRDSGKPSAVREEKT